LEVSRPYGPREDGCDAPWRGGRGLALHVMPAVLVAAGEKKVEAEMSKRPAGAAPGVTTCGGQPRRVGFIAFSRGLSSGVCVHDLGDAALKDWEPTHRAQGIRANPQILSKRSYPTPSDLARRGPR